MPFAHLSHRRAVSLIGAAALLLGGCSLLGSSNEEAAEAQATVQAVAGAFESRASRISLSIVAEPDMNMSPEGWGAPLMFQILQLKDDSMLMAADSEQLRDDLERALGTNYLTHDDFTMLPGHYKFYEPFAVDPETRYIGLVAFFADANQAEWKKVVRIDARGRDYPLLVHLREHEADLRKPD